MFFYHQFILSTHRKKHMILLMISQNSMVKELSYRGELLIIRINIRVSTLDYSHML
jgi:hypothetical protein